MDAQTLRVLVIEREHAVVLQGLDLDISAQGSSLEEAQDRFTIAMNAELFYCADNSLDPNRVIGKAPEYVFNLWDTCESFEDSSGFEMRRCA